LLREQAYERFKERLFARELSPGQFVSQRALADLVGVSEGPMREALKRLEAEALVRLIPQRGIQIAEINVALIRDAFGLRVVLETAAAKNFVRTASNANLADLEARFLSVLERIRRRRDPRLLDEALAADVHLHQSMIESMDNALISEVYRINHDKIRLIRLNSRFTFERVLPGIDEHLAIIARLKARDAEGVVAALERHLAVSLRRSLGVTE
jgi:DNA-binding GntR family transcriptional regulator